MPRPHAASVQYLEFTSAADAASSKTERAPAPLPQLPPRPAPPRTLTSSVEWSREPTTYDALFGLALPYRPPRNAVGAFLWRRRVWLETTFALSMMQPWEKVLIVCLMTLLWGLFTAGIYLYLPQHFKYLHGRAMYYLLGTETGLPSPWTWSSAWATVANSTSPLGGALKLRGDSEL